MYPTMTKAEFKEPVGWERSLGGHSEIEANEQLMMWQNRP
jgi:hypothetical protein